MSTQINVTVDSGGLAERAKEQQAAARQAQLEKERQQSIEALATAERNAKLAAEGKAPGGSNLYNPDFEQPEIERRPAATIRSSGANFVFVPHETYNVSGIAVKTKNINNKNFSYRNLTGSSYAVPDFISNDGPGGGTYLQGANTEGDSLTKATLLEYAVCDNTDVVAVGNTPVDIRTQTGSIIAPTQIKKPIFTYKYYTSECYLYAPNIPELEIGNFPEECITSWGGIADICSNLFSAPSASAAAYIYLEDFENNVIFPFFSCEISAVSINPANVLQPDQSKVTISINNMGKTCSIKHVEPERWHHVAVSVRNDIATFFFNGQIVEPTTIVEGNWENVHNVSTRNIVEARVSTNTVKGTGLAPNGEWLTGIAGLRFTPRALYAAPFTPPAGITTFA